MILQRTLDFLRRRSTAYRLTFGNSPNSQWVLADLAVFCRATESTFSPDARLHAVLEGRREVWLRIQQHLNLTPAQLFALYDVNRQARTMPTEED